MSFRRTAMCALALCAALFVHGEPALASGPDFVEVAPETPYASGTRVGVTALGLSFEVPPNWIGRLPQGSEFLFLASHTEPGLVLVTARQVTLEEARAFFSQPLPLDASTIAQPAGAPTVEGQIIRQQYTVATPQGSMTGQAVAKLGTAGGVAFLAFGPDASAARTLADRLLGSVVEHPLPKPGEAPTGAIASALRGKKLLYMRTVGGFSDEEHIHLCSDGTARTSASTTGVSPTGTDFGSYNDRSRSQATWTVRGDQLLVISPNGSTRRWQVTLSGDGSARIEQSNWWIRPQNVCP